MVNEFFLNMHDDLIKFLIDVFDQLTFLLNVEDFVVDQLILVQSMQKRKEKIELKRF